MADTTVSVADAGTTDDDYDDDEDMADGPRKRGDRSPGDIDRRIGKRLLDHREALPGGPSRELICEQLTELHPSSPWGAGRLRRIEVAAYRITFTDVDVLLRFYGINPAVFLQQVEFFTLEDSTESRIANDPYLDDTTRKHMLGMYQDAVGKGPH